MRASRRCGWVRRPWSTPWSLGKTRWLHRVVEEQEVRICEGAIASVMEQRILGSVVVVVQTSDSSPSLHHCSRDNSLSSQCELTADECAYIRQTHMTAVQSQEFIASRVALRRAIQLACSSSSLMPVYSATRTPGCGPVVDGWSVSLSHKPTVAAAVAQQLSPGVTLFTGIDIEHCQYQNKTYFDRLVDKISTSSEKNHNANVDFASLEELTTLRFSLKEALYKAIHPIVKRYVSHKEVEVYPQADGTANVNLLSVLDDRVRVEARWMRHQQWWVSLVQVHTQTNITLAREPILR